MAGLLPWFFISQTLYSSSTCLVTSREVLLAFKIEPFVIVAANVLDQFISFMVAFLIVVTFVVLPNVSSFTFLQVISIPIDLIMIFYFILMFNFLLAFWYAFYRDINYITNFLLGLMFYITPIFYEASQFPEAYNWVLKMNLFIPFVSTFQISFHHWNGLNWEYEIAKTLLINCILTLMVKWSLKRRLKDFYVSV
jgi:ABC-type polysaccharide/polyol phosphate export permease